MTRASERDEARGLQSLLALVSKGATLKAILAWSPKQFAAAEEWAAAEHLHASDNPVPRRPCPRHVRVLPEIRS